MAEEIATLKQMQAGLNAQFEALYAAKDAKSAAKAKEQLVGLSYATAGVALGPAFSLLGLSGQHINFSIVRAAIDLKLFEIIAAKPSTLDEIVQQTGASRDLLKRMLRLLSANGLLLQKELDKWEASPLTHGATVPGIRAWLMAHFDKRVEISAELPQWLRDHKHQCSWDDKDPLVKRVYGTDFWTWCAENPQKAAEFDLAMSIQESFPPETKPPYPLADELAGIKTDVGAVTLVDVGGGFGAAIEDIKQSVPNVPGKFVLQDLPKTINAVDSAKAKAVGFEATAHDFFTPQPVKGAKYYHFRRVFHDWNDEKCLEILAATRGALEPGYSKVLIHDIVMPDVNPGPQETMIDIIMMTLVDGKERSESEWRELLSKAGLKIDKILRADVGTIGVIEASLA